MTELQTQILAVWAWCWAHPEYSGPALAFLLLTIYSYVPRTPPKNPTLFQLWSVLERLTFLSWAKWGGPLKMFGVVEPNPETWAQEQPTRKDTPTLPPSGG